MPTDSRPSWPVRFSLDQDGLGVYEDEQGEYIRFEDYARVDREHDAALIERDNLRAEVEKLKVKANLWNDLIAARNQTAAEPDDTEWKRVAREQGAMTAIRVCRATHGYSLREARDVVESYLASSRHAKGENK